MKECRRKVEYFESEETTPSNVVAAFETKLHILRQSEEVDEYFETKLVTLPGLIVDPREDIDSSRFINRTNLGKILTHMNLPAESVMSAWDRSYYYSDAGEHMQLHRNEYALLNFEKLCELEANRPGSPKVLNDEFGIKTFGRYHHSTLIDQYDNRNNRDDAYGLAVFTRGDHNGAFYGDFLREKGDPLIRIYEVESREDFMRKLISAKRRYGPQEGKGGHKISYGLVSAHGTEVDIDFDGVDPLGDNLDSIITTYDIYAMSPKLAQFFMNMFDEGFVGIFNSCATGVEGGFAHQVAHKLKCTTIAPDKKTSQSNIQIKQKSDALSFDVVYSKANTMTYTPQSPLEAPIVYANEIPTSAADISIFLEPVYKE